MGMNFTEYFTTTESWGIFSSFSSLTHTKARNQLFDEPSFGWLPDHMPSHKTDILDFVLWQEDQIVVLL
jgi:hypothetical protein